MIALPPLRQLLSVVVLALALAACATEASRDVAAGGPATMLSLRGKISAELGDQFTALIPPAAAARPTVVHLASGGGDFDGALRIAKRLEALPQSTAVVTRECDSACVLIFLAARERLVAPGAILAVHAPQCIEQGLIGLPCRVFWEPWARSEFRARLARVSPPWSWYLDAQDPPAFARVGAASVRVTGAQLIAFGAAKAYSREAVGGALSSGD